MTIVPDVVLYTSRLFFRILSYIVLFLHNTILTCIPTCYRGFVFCLSIKYAIFAEDMPHSGNKERALFPLVCIIFAADKIKVLTL